MNQSFLQAKASAAIYEKGKKHHWWPFDSRDQFDQYLKRKSPKLRGNGDFVLVGLNSEKQLVVQEIQSIADTVNATEDAFVVSYSSLLEGVIYGDTY